MHCSCLYDRAVASTIRQLVLKNYFTTASWGPSKRKKIRGPWARAQCAHWLRRPCKIYWNKHRLMNIFLYKTAFNWRQEELISSGSKGIPGAWKRRKGLRQWWLSWISLRNWRSALSTSWEMKKSEWQRYFQSSAVHLRGEPLLLWMDPWHHLIQSSVVLYVRPKPQAYSTGRSGLTTWIPQTVYCYLWAYPFFTF